MYLDFQRIRYPLQRTEKVRSVQLRRAQVEYILLLRYQIINLKK